MKILLDDIKSVDVSTQGQTVRRRNVDGTSAGSKIYFYCNKSLTVFSSEINQKHSETQFPQLKPLEFTCGGEEQREQRVVTCGGQKQKDAGVLSALNGQDATARTTGEKI